MSKKLTEKKVLKKLNIKDFGCLSLDNIGKFTSMLPQMDPEVAKKALEQFPEFAQAGKEIVSEFCNMMDKILESSDKCMTQQCEICKEIIESLNTELNRENITHNQRMEIIDKIIEVNREISEMRSNHQEFLLKTMAICGGIGGALVGITVIVMGSSIGNNIEINTKRNSL